MPTILNDVIIRNRARYFTATVDGVQYEIPELWSIAYCTTHGGSAIEAAMAWAEQARLAAEHEKQQVRAIVRHNDNGYITVLCPRGHVITACRMKGDFAGSAFESELGQWQAGRPNRFDRQAATCQGAGCDGR